MQKTTVNLQMLIWKVKFVKISKYNHWIQLPFQNLASVNYQTLQQMLLKELIYFTGGIFYGPSDRKCFEQRTTGVIYISGKL